MKKLKRKDLSALTEKQLRDNFENIQDYMVELTKKYSFPDLSITPRDEAPVVDKSVPVIKIHTA